VFERENAKAVNEVLFPKREKQDGPRIQVIEAYKKGGFMAAYHTFRVLNKNKIYSKEDFDSWIKKYDESQGIKRESNNSSQNSKPIINSESEGRIDDDDAR